MSSERDTLTEILLLFRTRVKVVGPIIFGLLLLLERGARTSFDFHFAISISSNTFRLRASPLFPKRTVYFRCTNKRTATKFELRPHRRPIIGYRNSSCLRRVVFAFYWFQLPNFRRRFRTPGFSNVIRFANVVYDIDS